MYVAFTYNK